MQIGIESKRLKHAVDWLKGVGAEYVHVAERGGKLKAMAAVFAHGEVVLADGAEQGLSVHLDVTALQRFAAKVISDEVVLTVDEGTVLMKGGKTKVTFSQPATARTCADIQPKGVIRLGLHSGYANLLAKYVAKDGQLSCAKVVGSWAYAHDRIAALAVPVAQGQGFLTRKVLEWASADDAQFYCNPQGSFVREPGTGSVLYESHPSNLTSWPSQIAQRFAQLENFQPVFGLEVAALKRVLQAYSKLDAEQAIRISNGDEGGDVATVTIQGTKTVIEDELAVECEGPFAVVLASATLTPFLNAAPETMVRFRYDDHSPYLVAVDDFDARLLTPKGA